MKIHLPAVAAGLFLLTGVGVAAAQDIVIVPEQEKVIREYVVKQQVVPVEVPADVQISVGTTLPDTVELRAIEVPDVQYQYVVVGGQTVLVEPGTRKIVHIIQ